MGAAPAASQDKGRVPAHVAIIMDGNGRWAKARGLPRVAGHKKGAEALRELLTECRGLGVEILTIYAFSSENWNRPESEVSDLMQLLSFYLEREQKTLNENGIRLKVIGDISQLDSAIRKRIADAENSTAKNTSFKLNVALSYGGRGEITHAVRTIAEKVKAGELAPADVNEATIAQHLFTAGEADPDLLIRTGGEHRLSNFLLWQQAYTELYFTSVHWPDFSIEHFKEAIAEYTRRERRYGGTMNDGRPA